ncbi:MAG: SPFH domain-containing protein [Gammaproteobacteria bacterium]|nr:SPFH domain-containing protein [Gammaproteobacteria bacterium]
MALWDKLFSEFVDVIDWTNDDNDTMVHRFERYNNEIKFGAKLTVRESQVAIFVNEGEIADILEPGMYELTTANLPVLSTLQSWQHGFESPFKAEVYFFNMVRFQDLKWGTKNPVILRDKEFGPIRIRGFGTYSIRIDNPKAFLLEIVGTDGHFSVDEISNQLRNLIMTRFLTILASSGIPVLDMTANYDQLSEYLTQKISSEFNEYGLKITKFLVENISVPPVVEAALDKRTSMGVIGSLEKYMQFQSAEAIEAAAKNPSGGASEGIGFGMGFAMAQKMGDSLVNSNSLPPALQTNTPYFIADNNEAKGPFELDEVRAMVKADKIKADTLVWKQGHKNWIEAKDFAELHELASVELPPPLPTKK